MLSKIIEIGVGLLMVAVLIPVALTTLSSSSTNMTAAGVDPVVLTVLLVLVPVLAIIGLAVYFIPRMKH